MADRKPVTPRVAAAAPRQIAFPHAVTVLSRSGVPLILAPMAGVSEAPFRQICRRYRRRHPDDGVPLRRSDPPRDPANPGGAEFEEVERPIGVQIYGADPDAMARAAAHRHRGLSARVHRHQLRLSGEEGGAAERRLRAACATWTWSTRSFARSSAATHLPVTVKTRSGWNEETRDPVGIALRMQDAGARAFTLHARTRTQMFTGQGRLGRDRPGGGGAGHSGHRQRRHAHARPTSSGCASTPAARRSWSGGARSATLDIP